MDYIKFDLPDNSFKIELSKTPRTFGYSNFGNFICTMKFIDQIGVPHAVVQGNEKQFFEFMNCMNDLNNNPYDYMDMVSYFMMNDSFTFAYMTSPVQYDTPTEDDDKMTMQIFEDSIYGRRSLIYLEFNFTFLEEFIFNIFQLLSDLNYLSDMGYSSLLDIIERNYKKL
jgi:hypothetical protein